MSPLGPRGPGGGLGIRGGGPRLLRRIITGVLANSIHVASPEHKPRFPGEVGVAFQQRVPLAGAYSGKQEDRPGSVQQTRNGDIAQPPGRRQKSR